MSVSFCKVLLCGFEGFFSFFVFPSGFRFGECCIALIYCFKISQGSQEIPHRRVVTGILKIQEPDKPLTFWRYSFISAQILLLPPCD